MKRRDLARHALSAAVVARWPAWLRRAFAGPLAGQACPPGTKPGALSDPWLPIVADAYRRAQDRGKPLLVLVVPADVGDGYERGSLFGELLNHGDDQALALLALVEVVCAPVAALKALVPSLAPTDALMLLVETDGVPARVQALNGAIPPLPGWRYPKKVREEDDAVDNRIAVVAKLLRAALVPDAAAVQRRARQAESRLGADNVVDLRAGLAQTVAADPAALDATAAILYADAAGLQAARRQAVLAALAEGARRRLVRKRVPGSRWASASGCGSHPELEPGENDARLGIMCGMGHVPRKSRRFLDFLTREGKWQGL